MYLLLLINRRGLNKLWVGWGLEKELELTSGGAFIWHTRVQDLMIDGIKS